MPRRGVRPMLSGHASVQRHAAPSMLGYRELGEQRLELHGLSVGFLRHLLPGHDPVQRHAATGVRRARRVDEHGPGLHELWRSSLPECHVRGVHPGDHAVHA